MHYLTLELLAHGGVNHQVALFRSFPQLPAQEYSMRNTGNQGIEAIHGMFRGGTTSLPITSPNLSFQEFLSQMNQALQIHTAEHSLKQIQGNPIAASKNKRLLTGVLPWLSTVISVMRATTASLYSSGPLSKFCTCSSLESSTCCISFAGNSGSGLASVSASCKFNAQLWLPPFFMSSKLFRHFWS